MKKLCGAQFLGTRWLRVPGGHPLPSRPRHPPPSPPPTPTPTRQPWASMPISYLRERTRVMRNSLEFLISKTRDQNLLVCPPIPLFFQ